MFIKSLVQLIVRIFYPYGSLRKIRRGYLKGSRFYVAPSMGLTYAMDIGDLNWPFLKNRIIKGSVVWDVGANRGQMGLFFSKVVGTSGSTYCFEPMCELVKELENNLHINNMSNVQVYSFALSSEDGKADFFYTENQSTQGKLASVEVSYVLPNIVSVEVETRTADGLIMQGFESPDVMKIDVEGAAAVVFSGARKLLDQHPDIYLELHGPEEQKAIDDYLVIRGYKFWDMDGNEIADPVTTWCSPIWCSVKE